MKYQIARFKSLKVALKELEPFIRNGEHLQTGKPFARFGGLRSREMLANWLICVALNFTSQEDRLTFWGSSDPLGADGIIYDTVTETTWPTEHVLVPWTRGGEAKNAGALILKAIECKQIKGGAAYASGKILVVFLNAMGEWCANAVAKQLPETLYFKEVWAVSLQYVKAGDYVYAVTLLDLGDGNAPTWRVRIGRNFDAWEVEPIQ